VSSYRWIREQVHRKYWKRSEETDDGTDIQRPMSVFTLSSSSSSSAPRLPSSDNGRAGGEEERKEGEQEEEGSGSSSSSGTSSSSSTTGRSPLGTQYQAFVFPEKNQKFGKINSTKCVIANTVFKSIQLNYQPTTQ
jgi:hypothetical protein